MNDNLLIIFNPFRYVAKFKEAFENIFNYSDPQ